MAEEDIFLQENAALESAQELLRQLGEDESVPKGEFRNLTEAYRKMLRQSRKLMKISDNLQNQLNKAKEELESFNLILEEKNNDLERENLKNQSLQNIIRSYIPKNTWAKADLNSQNAILDIQEEELVLTCLFLDVVQFTRFSEKLIPREVIQAVNSVFSPLVDIIYKRNGDIDKFIGDAIFAVFQDPFDAMETAFDIQRKLQEDQQFQVRIGIHTGRVIIGNVGGSIRKDNTLMGDTVNTASRLERVCFPGEIVYSDMVHEITEKRYTPYHSEDIYLRGKEGLFRLHRIKLAPSD